MKKKDGFDGQQAVVIPRKILQEQCAQNDLMAALYITDMGYYPKARFHHRVRPDGVDQHILIYCVDGKGSARFNRQTYSVSAGDFFIIPRKTAHSYSADEADPWTIYWVHFDGSASDTVIRSLENKAESLKSTVPCHAGSPDVPGAVGVIGFGFCADTVETDTRTIATATMLTR